MVALFSCQVLQCLREREREGFSSRLQIWHKAYNPVISIHCHYTLLLYHEAYVNQDVLVKTFVDIVLFSS